jgi:hypothetical protein
VSTVSPLTHALLTILFAQPDVARRWKDTLADRILDLHARGAPLEAHAILDHLFVHAPRVLERLLEDPRVKDDLERFLTPVAPPPPHERPRPTRTEHGGSR